MVVLELSGGGSGAGEAQGAGGVGGVGNRRIPSPGVSCLGLRDQWHPLLAAPAGPAGGVSVPGADRQHPVRRLGIVGRLRTEWRLVGREQSSPESCCFH